MSSVTAPTNVYWNGANAFFSASTVSVTLDDGATYSFQDDLDRPLIVNSGGSGEEISREDDWTENGIERRLKFYFEGISSSTLTPNGTSLDFYWYSSESRLYDSTSEWVYAGGWVDPNTISSDTILAQAPMGSLYHCDHVILNYCGDDQDPWTDTCTKATLEATDVYLGGFLDENYQVCELEAVNPCADNDDDKTYCRAINGAVECIEPPPTTTTVMQARSAIPITDSRFCEDGSASGSASGSAGGNAGSSVIDVDEETTSETDTTPNETSNGSGGTGSSGALAFRSRNAWAVSAFVAAGVLLWV